MGDSMQIRFQVLDYIEKSRISTDKLARELHMEKDRFQKDNERNWSAQELLEIYGYLQVDPRMFWERTNDTVH